MTSLIHLKSRFVRPRRLLLPLVAVALAAIFGVYEFAQPASANPATPLVGAAAPMDNASIGPILSLDHAMEALAARVTPAVVNVSVTARLKQARGSAEGQEIPPEIRRFFGEQFGDQFGRQFSSPFGQQRRQPQVEHGVGSGVILSPDGYIVTNNHVVANATDVQVTMSDRRVMSAKVIGADPLTDLAVIKVNATNLPNIGWGDSTALHPGQTVLAFGNPLNMRFTVTRGIVSALNRPNPFAEDRHAPGEFIQTDAAINPGNSGGPLVDARGQVVGINTFLLSESGGFSGMGFAIPSQIARPTVEKLIRSGKIEHAYMGVGINDVTPETAHFFHLSEARGAVVSQVEAASPGSRAGLKVGDVIIAVNGQKVADSGELQVAVGQNSPGATVHLDLLRDGRQMSVPVTLGALGKDNVNGENGESEAGASTEHGQARWGLALADVTPDLRQQLSLPSGEKGVAVMQVEPGSHADNAGLSSGDVILSVNRHDVTSVAEAQKALADVPAGQDALLLVWTRGGSTFVVMHGSASPSSNGGGE